MTRSRLITMIATATCALALGACGDDDDTDETSVAAPPQTQTAPPAETPATTEPATDADEPAAGGAECKQVDTPPAKEITTPKPTGRLPAGRNVVTMTTSCGTIEIELDAKDNPKTANSFATLAKAGDYDRTAFLRVVPGFVIQGGDPSGTQSGGPPWQVVETPTGEYRRGTVAMAKSGADPVGASGSQFFIVLADETPLTPDYAIAGRVVKGMDVADAIVGLAEPGVPDGPPSRPAIVEKATLR